MKIRILGTRGKIEAKLPRHTKHSGILIDDKILIDVGEKKFLNYNPQFIFFTHLHPDHAWFVETNEMFDISVPVYTPEASPLIKNHTIISEPVTLDGYIITPVPTIHSIKVSSQGYVIEKEGQRIFYSADMVWIEKKHHHLLSSLDLVITDGSFIRKGGAIRRKDDQIFGHNGIPDLINFFKKFTPHIVFTHFGTWFMKSASESKNKIKSLGKNGLKIDVAYDGKEYII
jgi:ribonuclease BN (tRNA processing enzyme)